MEHGYIVETLEPNTPWSRDVRELERRNIHRVPKAKIRSMIDRYEHNITGDRLLRMFKLSYKPRNQPPQMRKLPSLPKTEEPLEKKLEKVTIKEGQPKITNVAAQQAQVIEEKFRRFDDDYWFNNFENYCISKYFCVFFLLLLFVNDLIKD